MPLTEEYWPPTVVLKNGVVSSCSYAKVGECKKRCQFKRKKLCSLMK